jgi:hypothetical protein
VNYSKIANKYRPKKITTLLVGEAPPPNRKSYFYLPIEMNPNRNRRKYVSLPATVFFHYFKRVPKNINEYIVFLKRFQKRGIFLIDIVDEPIRVRGNPEGVCKIIKGIRSLRKNIKKKKINIEDKNVIFLLARKGYEKYIKQEFPNSERIYWVDYRVSS